MDHKIFEAWILDKSIQLSLEDTQKLKLHVDHCPSCQQLQTNWGLVEKVLSTKPEVLVPNEFSLHWQQNLEQKKLLSKRIEIRRTFSIITVGILVSGSAFGLIASRTTSVVKFLTTLIEEIVSFYILFSNLGLILSPLLKSIPPALILGVISLSIITVTIMIMSWALAIWQVAMKGATQNENF